MSKIISSSFISLTSLSGCLRCCDCGFVARAVGGLVDSLQVGGVPGGVLGEQQAAAGLLLEMVDEDMIEGGELLLLTQEQWICPGAGGTDLSGVSPSIDDVMLEGFEYIKDEDFIEVLGDVRCLESVEK